MDSLWHLGDELRGQPKVVEDRQWSLMTSKLAEITRSKGERMNDLDYARMNTVPDAKQWDKTSYQHHNESRTEPRRAASSNPSTVALGRRSPSVSPPHSASAGGSTTSPCRSSTSSTRSTTPSPRSTWMDGYSDGGNDDAYGDDGGYGDNIPTRDFLSRPATFSSAAPYNPNAFGMPSSSSLNPSRLDFGGLDLNSGSDWAAMLGYEDLLRSGGVDGSHGPPPVRVPGRSGRGTLGLRGARGGRGRGGSASAGSGSAFAGGFVSPTPTGRGASSRGTRGGRRRGGRRRVGADVAASTVADDSDDEEEYGEADDSDDEFDRLLLANLMQEEAAAAAAMYGMSAVAMHLDKYCNRSEFREVGPGLSGLEWVERKLGNPTACYKMFRMTPTMFYRLHDMLCNNYGLQSSEKSSSIEALGMFLWMVGAPQSVRQAEDRFERSLGTVHSFFYKVLNCLRRLADDIIKPRDPQFRTMHTRLDNPRFYPFFKDCIGAIDGTHIPCVVSKDLVVQYMCRKNITTQNVMACCDFDLIFTFVLAGWPGSVHDMRVFNDAMNKYTDVFPHPPPGKYYLVDSGYANRPGYLAPYRGTKYHLQEYQNAEEPQGKEELFNYAHSSLRNCIERSFGVLKQKWRILMHLPSYPIETQTHIIVACMALHNFIRLSGLRDRHFGRCDRDPRYVPSVASVDQPPTEQAPTILDSRQMNEFRDSIALQMLEGSL